MHAFHRALLAALVAFPLSAAVAQLQDKNLGWSNDKPWFSRGDFFEPAQGEPSRDSSYYFVGTTIEHGEVVAVFEAITSFQEHKRGFMFEGGLKLALQERSDETWYVKQRREYERALDAIEARKTRAVRQP
jgi:hypothetical protein